MRIDDAIGGKLAGYEMVEAKFNGTVVWPLNYTYLITAARVVYSAGSAIYAKGSYAWDGNYAYVLGTVNVYINGVLVNTLTDVRLTPTVEQGSWFSVDTSLNILGNNLGTVPSAQHNETVTVAYGNSSTTVTVSQQANVKTPTSYTPTGSKHYGLPTVTAYNYQVDFSTNKYGSAASAAPASGATTTDLRATLSITANHIEVTTTPWTQDALVNYSYTSGATSSATEADYYSGTDTSSPVQVTDTPTITGSATGFTRSGMYVTIASEGTTSYPSGRSVTYTASVDKMGGGTQTDTVTLYQAKNEIVSDEPSTVRTYGSPYQESSDGNYVASVVITQYTSSSSPAPASGGSAGLIITASHEHTVTTKRDWTDTTIHTYTWSSGSSSHSQPSYDYGTETMGSTTTTVTDNPTPIFSVANEGFSFNSDYTAINIASRENTYSSSTRSAQVKVTNGTASSTAWIYQAKNGRASEYVYDLSVAIQYNGAMFPDTGGIYTVNAHSYRYTRYTYDSGVIEDVSRTNYTAQLTKVNCNTTTTVNTIYGEKTFQIEVAPNPSTTDVRTVGLTLTAGNTTATDTRFQDTMVEPGVGNVAILLPYIPKVGTNKGKVYYTLEIKHGSVTSSLVSLNFCYRRNGGSKQTVNVGGYTISETSSPVLFQASGIPNFANDRSVKAWFEVQSTGSFNVIYANETDYYTYVEFDPYIPPTPEPNT